MYRYNAVIHSTVTKTTAIDFWNSNTTTIETYNKIFYGTTIGIDYRFNPARNIYWIFALLIPIRNRLDINSFIKDLNKVLNAYNNDEY